MRSGHSGLRAAIQVEEWDAAHGLKKFNPLAGWREDEVWSYIRRNDVPYNPLHDQGYPRMRAPGAGGGSGIPPASAASISPPTAS